MRNRYVLIASLLCVLLFIPTTAAAQNCSSFSDNFNRAALGANWTVRIKSPSTSNATIVGNALQLKTVSTNVPGSVEAYLNRAFAGDFTITTSLLSSTQTPDNPQDYNSNNLRIYAGGQVFELNFRYFSPTRINISVFYRGKETSLGNLTYIPSSFSAKLERIGSKLYASWGAPSLGAAQYVVPDFPTASASFAYYISVSKLTSAASPAGTTLFDNLVITCNAPKPVTPPPQPPKTTTTAATAKPVETATTTATSTAVVSTPIIVSDPVISAPQVADISLAPLLCCLLLLLILLIVVLVEKKQKNFDRIIAGAKKRLGNGKSVEVV